MQLNTEGLLTDWPKRRGSEVACLLSLCLLLLSVRHLVCFGGHLCLCCLQFTLHICQLHACIPAAHAITLTQQACMQPLVRGRPAFMLQQHHRQCSACPCQEASFVPNEPGLTRGTKKHGSCLTGRATQDCAGTTGPQHVTEAPRHCCWQLTCNPRAPLQATTAAVVERDPFCAGTLLGNKRAISAVAPAVRQHGSC